jgi:glycosyltransferase involved in cell wall biosynthesis
MVDVARMPKGQMKWYRRVGRLRANSDPVAEAIKKETASPQHKQICTIPNPLPFSEFSSFNVSEKKPVILFVGRIHPEKGIDLLLKAIQKLKNDWQVKIVGSSDVRTGGGGSAYLDHLISLNSVGNIEFIGPVYDVAELNRYYAEASIFVYPSVSEKGETFGLAPLEAMAWGCVPVVSEISCFKDFIFNERNGLIFDHRDQSAVELLTKAIARLQYDKILRVKLAKEALEVRKTHSISNIACLFLQEFEKMRIGN